MMIPKEQIRFIRFPELQEILGGISRAKVERDVASGILPAPFKLGKRCVAWRSDELEEAMAKFTRIEDAYDSQIRKMRRKKYPEQMTPVNAFIRLCCTSFTRLHLGVKSIIHWMSCKMILMGL